MTAWTAGAPETSGRRSLDGLQYLRGLAAVAVVFDHAAGMLAEDKYVGHELPLASVFYAGTLGVYYFFCLSGFIIVYISQSAALTPITTMAEFARRRFVRIVPYMWVAIVSFALLRLTRGVFPALDYLRALTLWPVGHLEPSHIWTLRVEATFYVVFALACLSRPRWRIIFPAWIVAGLIAGIYPLRRLGVDPALAEWALAFFNPINLLFGCGALFAITYLRFGDRWPAPPAWVLLPVMASVYPVALFIQDHGRSTLTIAAVAPFCLAAVALAVLAKPLSGPIGRVARLLGDASYSIYLMHGIFVAAALGVLSRLHLWDFAVFAGAVAAGTIGGVVCHFLLERPLVRWLSARLRPRHPAAPGQAA